MLKEKQKLLDCIPVEEREYIRKKYFASKSRWRIAWETLLKKEPTYLYSDADIKNLPPLFLILSGLLILGWMCTLFLIPLDVLSFIHPVVKLILALVYMASGQIVILQTAVWLNKKRQSWDHFED